MGHWGHHLGGLGAPNGAPMKRHGRARAAGALTPVRGGNAPHITSTGSGPADPAVARACACAHVHVLRGAFSSLRRCQPCLRLPSPVLAAEKHVYT
eukprot:364594-Chlamydomonas_euryale.AAC.14